MLNSLEGRHRPLGSFGMVRPLVGVDAAVRLSTERGLYEVRTGIFSCFVAEFATTSD
jgi:hypothetical protein